MDTLTKEFDDWINKSPPEEEIREVLKVLKRKQEETFKVLEGIRDHETDEVEALRARLELLRGEEKDKSSDSSSGKTAIEKAYINLKTNRYKVMAEMKKEDHGVITKEDSELFVNIIKVVFSYVRKEQQEQVGKIRDLLFIGEKEDTSNISNLQRTLGYDIENALLEAFLKEAWSKEIFEPYKSHSPYLCQVEGKIHSPMKKFVHACIKLVWLMLMEPTPLEFCWNFSNLHYRYYTGEKDKSFGANARIIMPAIGIKQNTGGMENKIKGELQS